MSLRIWAARTIFNWRWYVVAPLVPVFILIILMYQALETAEQGIMRVMWWKRQGDKA